MTPRTQTLLVRLRQAASAASAALLLGASAWGVGFAWFDHAARSPGPPPPAADGIVVLTGGAGRIETALRLLAEGRAPLLLVSGVARHAELSELTRRVSLDPAQVAGQVTLGRAATTTVGNGAEIAQWAHEHAMRRLIVVTAGYHMPRALLEIRRGLPDAELLPVPVLPPALRGGTDPGTARMLANEYDKLIAVRLGLAPLLQPEVHPR